ncbi:dihydrofolate reductase family protein [Oerskovia enterophila]|uniref:Bacterial bifunctional deaminase-reductase C-terminal domain-containing protein n=1 Tax=Oerskovia enterophila TaxID=43678 RepID=A0ABX2Y443_9CELL|nr:dihydrofolate reductase family protein [Oerskovia enterophila]OCI31323.1 hypothetical protein OERS_20080 [Oerskovia enterophila]
MTTTREWTGCVFIGVSLDGFIARPDGSLDWLTAPALQDHVAPASTTPALVWETFFPTVDTVVMGRSTYETVLGFDEWAFDGKDVVVLSTTLRTDDPRIHVAPSVEDVRQLLDRKGPGRVYVDGGRTIQSFLAAGLVDELTLSVAPLLLGTGKRLFGALDRDVRLTVRGVHTTADDGLVRVTYAVTSA